MSSAMQTARRGRDTHAITLCHYANGLRQKSVDPQAMCDRSLFRIRDVETKLANHSKEKRTKRLGPDAIETRRHRSDFVREASANTGIAFRARSAETTGSKCSNFSSFPWPSLDVLDESRGSACVGRLSSERLPFAMPIPETIPQNDIDIQGTSWVVSWNAGWIRRVDRYSVRNGEPWGL